MPNIPELLNWYDNFHRDLPWRRTRDPYKIWLSEIILQQTRIDQGLAYYERFVSQFPDVLQLAAADEDTVLKLWQGLGYYSRARNMHQAARYIADELDGHFPDNYDDILNLKGVGPYTAAAISSIVFGEARPVLDGNVMRVISRWYAITDAVDTSKGKKHMTALLNTLIDKQQPGKFNQAMMEFGATWCKPRNPACEQCIFSTKCLAFKQKTVDAFPVKSGKVKVRNRIFYYLVAKIDVGGKLFTLIKKRDGNDIWKGLYEFPMVELNTTEPHEKVLSHPGFGALINPADSIIRQISRPYIHQLTHQKITAKFIVVESTSTGPETAADYLKIPLSELHKYPVSRLTSKFLENNTI